MATLAAQFALESDWIMALLGVLVTMFSALAWFVRQTVSNSVKELEARMRADLKDINAGLGDLRGHLQDLNDRVGRIERQVDEKILPHQSRIARKLDAEDE